MTVSPPTLYWYQLTVGTLAPAYWGQLDTCVKALCVANSVTQPTALWYSPISGTLNTTWILQIDTAVRALCTALSVTPPTGSPTNLIPGAETPNYYSSLDATVRLLCAGGGGYKTSAVLFNAIVNPSEATLENSSLVQADSPLVMASMWLRPPLGGVGANRMWTLLRDENQFWSFDFYTDHIEVDLWNAAGTSHYLFRINGLTTVLADQNWHHWLFAADTNHAAHAKIGKLTLDGVAQTVLEGADANAAFPIGWTVGTAYVGASSAWDPSVHGNEVEIADLWVGMGQYADVSDSAIVAKFRDPATGKPISLGANGELPTGTSPTMFFRGNATTMGQPNLGTGTGFSKTETGSGAITTAATSPTD